MDPQLFILTQIHEACRETTLYDDYGSPSWTDGQFFRDCTLRLEREDDSAWADFLQRIGSDRDLTVAIRSMLMDRGVIFEVPDEDDVHLGLPSHVRPFSKADEHRFVELLDVRNRDKAVFPDPAVHYVPDLPHLYKTEDAKKFIPPSQDLHEQIMYIEMKPGLAGPARIGRVQFSKTRKTIYYHGMKLHSLKGSGYKANYYNVETAMWYWVSKCKKDGNDTLYPGVVEIDDDAREEYWTSIREQPENKNVTKFRSHGKYSKRQPR